MCDQSDNVAAESVAPPTLPAMEAAGVHEEIVSLWEVVNGLRQELVELRMDRRKVMLEELARLEEPLVEQGVIAGRTRPPRHR